MFILSQENQIKLIGLNGIPIIKEGDIISNIIYEALRTNKVILEDGDLIVINYNLILYIPPLFLLVRE